MSQQQPIKGIRFGANIAGAIINFIQYYTPITTFALQSSHPLVFQAAWEVIKIKLQPCTLQPWFMAITHEVYKKKDKNCSTGEYFMQEFFSLMWVFNFCQKLFKLKNIPEIWKKNRQVRKQSSPKSNLEHVEPRKNGCWTHL